MRALLVVLLWALASASASAGQRPLTFRAAPSAVRESENGQWRLRVHRDSFSGEVTCRLATRDGTAFFANGAVAFRFPHSWNTTGAVYRLDGGEPRRWREDLPELVRIGAPFDLGGIDNPSRGLVVIPLRRLENVNRLAIAAQPGRAPVTFPLRGLKPLYEVAAERGCAPGSWISA